MRSDRGAEVQHHRHSDQRGDQHVQRLNARIAQAHQIRDGEGGEEKKVLVSTNLAPMAISTARQCRVSVSTRGILRSPAFLGLSRASAATLRKDGVSRPCCGSTCRSAPARWTARTECASRRTGRPPPRTARQAEVAKLPSARPNKAPVWGTAPKKPRLCAGEYSTASNTPPPHSPPSASPCSRRSRVSRMGDQMLAGRRQADEHRGQAHDGQRDHQRLLAADAVPVREHDAADGTDQERQRERQRQQLAGDRIARRKEQLAKDDGRHRSVEEAVIPLDGAADRAAEQRAPAVGLADRGGFRTGVTARRPVAHGRARLST